MIYEQARCHNTAVVWLRRSLSDARSVGLTENVLLNLRVLAQNLNTLANYPGARPCYDEMLQLLEDLPPSEQISGGLVNAAMFHLQHGDQARGEAIMRTLRTDALHPHSTHFGTSPIPTWFAAALHASGMYYIATARTPDATALAYDAIENARRFEEPSLVTDGMHGLAAKAYLDQGNLNAALAELAQVHDVNSPEFVRYDKYVDPTTLELWIDVARIHVAHHRYELAMNAYQSLAYHLGALIVDRSFGNTTRLRMHWLQRMVVVVHEMASAWMEIADPDVRQTIEATVAKALLQVKVNLFVGIQKSKSVRVVEITDKIFMANRRFAAAVRATAAWPDSEDAMLELEAALFEREQLERIDLPFDENQLAPFPHMARMSGLTLPGENLLEWDPFSVPAGLKATLLGDVRELIESETVFVDYAVVGFQPPRDGRRGPLQGRRYLGIRVDREGYRIEDLGDAMEIERQCEPFIKACAAPGWLSEEPGHALHSVRNLVPDDSSGRGSRVEFDRLAEGVYERLVAPFEPLARSLMLSPDGMLTALPFHALLRNDRWLVEETDVRYCHSLHPREALFECQLNPSTRYLPPVKKVALVLGNPQYGGSDLVSLPGTELEISAVATLLSGAQFPSGQMVFDKVRVHTGPDAVASQLLGHTLPRVIHIAAHGGFERHLMQGFRERPIKFGEYYRAWDEMGAEPMTALDDGLLRCGLRLTKEPDAVADPAAGAVVTALELASLNLLPCHAVVLSACETGLGIPVSGAGAMGFQYALQATFARAGLVSLWKVLDHETAIFMTDFYKEFLAFKNESVGASYLNTLRRYGRRNGQRVHPYYWAAFVVIDGEYKNPVPW